MSGPGSEEPLSNISDTSFVILGPTSVTNQEDDEGLQKNSHLESSISSTSANTCLDTNKLGSNDSKCISKFSSSEESIQEKLNELVKENYHLKETLSQNNLAIKSQLDTFFMWQQEVLKTHETHKQKFLETKDLILKLRMENLSLKKQLEESAHGFSILRVGDSSSQIDKKFGNSDVLKERMKEFENICNELASKNENLETEKQKLVEELVDAKKEVSRLKKELEEVTVENMFLKQRAENLQKNSNESNSYKSLPNAEARTQISNLFKQLEEEKSKVSKLKEALKETKKGNEETSVSKGCTTDDFVHCIDKLNDMSHSLDMQNQRISGFHSWVTLVKGNLKENQRDEQIDCNLKSEIKEFKSYVNLEENASNEKQESVEELKEQFTKLLEDYKTLQQQLISLHGENQNIEKYKEEITSLSTELQIKDKELMSKQQECNDLKEEISKLNLEWEEKVSVLQIQAELYRSDFNSEREAREQLIREKEEMTEQVIFLQSQIQELEKSSLNERSSLASSGRKNSYKCPKCLISFTNLKNLEGHVDDCLDTLMYP